MSTVSPSRPQGHSTADAPAWALFLDFDGTLVEIAERPDAVVVPPDLGPVLRRLVGRLDGALAIVTGRPIAVIDDFLAPERFDVAGVHGAEYRLAGRFVPCTAEDHPELRRGLDRLRGRLAQEPGILVEDKGCSVGVHWRLVPQAEPLALSAAEELAAALGPAYRLQRGKSVAEVLPARASKGGVIREFLAEGYYRGRRPVFVGDDLTDEYGFEAVEAAGGIGIRIGPGPTRARYRVSDPSTFRGLLTRWAGLPGLEFEGLAEAASSPEAAG